MGRERELETLVGAIAGRRLVTLHGAGGAGKTRLAIELAARDGREAWFADLGRLPRGSAAWPGLAAAVGARDEPGSPLPEVVVRALAGEGVLVLDNCEHVRDGARDAASRVLDECEGVAVLATSREPLGLPAEFVWPVPPLGLPPSGSGLEEALAHDAPRLFAERARRALPGFEPHERDAEAIVRICHRLDGIPLALELAAARATALGPEDIAARLDDRFALLARGDPDAPSRQRTLRALVDWSYDLLDEPERGLLAQLSVFAAGFELDAVEHVWAGAGGPRALDVLTSLIEKALVSRGERDGHARCRLHETIREYAAGRLDEHGTTDAVRARHLDWCRALAAEADERWLGEGGAAWLDRVLAEQDNVRGALAWGLETGRSAEALDLAWRFGNFWLQSGQAEEAAGWLARALASTSDAPPSVDRARALSRVGSYEEARGDLDRARSAYEEALAVSEAIGDPVRRGVAMLSLAEVDRGQGRLTEARRWAEAGRLLLEPSDDRERLRWFSDSLGHIDLAEGNAGAAREHFEASRAEAVRLGNETTIAVTIRLLGEAEREAGEWTASRGHLSEALELARRQGDREAEAGALLSLGRLELDHDAGGAAHALLAAALRSADEAGMRGVGLDCLEALAEVRAAAGDAEAAAAILGSAEALRERLGLPLEPRERARAERREQRLGEALGRDRLAAARGAGRARGWGEAVAAALAAEAAGPDGVDVQLRRESDVWSLTRGSRTIRLRDSKGLRYLAVLLAAPGREVSVLELAGAGLDERGEPLLDDTARAAYRQRLAQLEDEIEEADRFADLERAAGLRDERDALVGELARALGLGSRARRLPSSAERARKAVGNRIRDAVARVEQEDPELGAHLRASVRMGVTCAYRPEPRSPWSVRVA